MEDSDFGRRGRGFSNYGGEVLHRPQDGGIARRNIHTYELLARPMREQWWGCVVHIVPLVMSYANTPHKHIVNGLTQLMRPGRSNPPEQIPTEVPSLLKCTYVYCNSTFFLQYTYYVFVGR